jgi:hypothetical protein
MSTSYYCIAKAFPGLGARSSNAFAAASSVSPVHSLTNLIAWGIIIANKNKVEGGAFLIDRVSAT